MTTRAHHVCVVCGTETYADVACIAKHVLKAHRHDLETYQDLVSQAIKRQRRRK
jgi:hypothetical protein